MKVDILTLFPQMFDPVLSSSILGRAQSAGHLSIALHNIRDYSEDKHKMADDYPFGGGAGMVMMAQPVYSCMDAVGREGAHVIYMSPRGRTLCGQTVHRLAQEPRLIVLCGHYEGIDERILDLVDEEISIGDYVLTGGEIPAMVLIDAVARYIPGVLSETATQEESFSDGLLEYPQYTRPAEFRGMKVPDVLLSGHHANIQRWRREQALLLTMERRPDLFADVELTKQDKAFLDKLKTDAGE